MLQGSFSCTRETDHQNELLFCHPEGRKTHELMILVLHTLIPCTNISLLRKLKLFWRIEKSTLTSHGIITIHTHPDRILSHRGYLGRTVHHHPASFFSYSIGERTLFINTAHPGVNRLIVNYRGWYGGKQDMQGITHASHGGKLLYPLQILLPVIHEMSTLAWPAGELTYKKAHLFRFNLIRCLKRRQKDIYLFLTLLPALFTDFLLLLYG